MKRLLLAVICGTLVIISTGEKVKRDTDPSKSSLLGLPDGHDDRKSEDDVSDILETLEEQEESENEEPKDSEYEYPKPGPDVDGMSEYSEDDYDLRLTDDGKDSDDYGALPGQTFEDDTPLVRCKRPLCRMYCPSGFQTDNSGCPVCSCLADPCEMMDCVRGSKCLPSECAAGTACVSLTAQCVPDVSRPAECPMIKCIPCSTGYEMDERGCQTCTCKRGCSGPEPMCATDCESLGGYKYTAEGCMTCDCNVDTPSPLVDDIGVGKIPCAVPSCDTDCFGNYKYDVEGCMTCECVGSDSLLASICNTQNAVYLVAVAGVLAVVMLLTSVFIAVKIIRRRRARVYRHRLLETQTSTNSQKSLLRDDGCVSVSLSDEKPVVYA